MAKVVEEIKKQSSKWMKGRGVPTFTWQGGYAAFSVNSHGVEVVTRYIENQKEHHKITSFKEEIEELVREYDMTDYDPKYFWD